MASADSDTQSSANQNSSEAFAPSHWPNMLVGGTDEPDTASLHTFALLGAAVAAADNSTNNNRNDNYPSSASMAVDSSTGESANNSNNNNNITFYPFDVPETPASDMGYYGHHGTGQQRMPQPVTPTEVGDVGGMVSLPGFTSPESAFYQYQNRMEGQMCQICGELAAGFHHGAYVCEACKKFFMRHSMALAAASCCTGRSTNTTCPTAGTCVISKSSRGRCQQCRYKKCLEVGMTMKDADHPSELDISNIPCRVCGGRSSGFHFGALTCEGCKGFFRRTEETSARLVCVGGRDNCAITPRSRNACKSCRFRRCIQSGMSKRGSRIGRQPNAVKFHCAIEIRQLQDSGQSLASDYVRKPSTPHGHLVPPTPHSHAMTPQNSAASSPTASSLPPSSSLQAVEGHAGLRRASAGACDLMRFTAVPPRRKASAPVKFENGEPGGMLSSSVAPIFAASSPVIPASPSMPPPLLPARDDSASLLEGTAWFNYEMRTATEFLRLPNQYFKSRFDIAPIEPEHARDSRLVWDHVMSHFQLHSQQIVQFAKLIPGFNQLNLSARGILVREGMFQVMLLLMARDYNPCSESGHRYNYFDFSSTERDIIFHHFPAYHRVAEHLDVSGRFFHQLNLSLPEFALSCTIQILKNATVLSGQSYTDANKLFMLARNALFTSMRAQNLAQEVLDNKWGQLETLGTMLTSMSKEHHEIAIQIKATRLDLNYPDLYIEMFQLADPAITTAALINASVLSNSSFTTHGVVLGATSAPPSPSPLPHTTADLRYPGTPLRLAGPTQTPQTQQPSAPPNPDCPLLLMQQQSPPVKRVTSDWPTPQPSQGHNWVGNNFSNQYQVSSFLDASQSEEQSQ